MKLYVGNLTFDTSENDLRELFGQFGKPTEVGLVTDRETGRSRGFAFVTMSSAEEGNAAAALRLREEPGKRAQRGRREAARKARRR